ncbi:MAG: branched-chain amino acid ABC transporter permease [Geobacteraceae bacterium]|nr:branched-chain amino acid ABC transporter permease [Geobacteraceae bacterium]
MSSIGEIIGTIRTVSPLSLLIFLAVTVALLLFPSLVNSPYALHLMILIFLSVIMGESWNILGGYAGQYSVGHAAYFGAGAYTTLMLMQFREIPPWYGVLAGIGVSILVALAIGSICFRLRGPYFVLASIAATEILRLTTLNLKEITNGAEGILATDIPPLRIGTFLVTDFATKVPFYYIGLVFALSIIAVTWIVQHSKIGYCFQAIREDQDAAHSLGINPSFYKNLSLAISAAFTSLAGSFYAVYIGFIDPTTVLSLDMSVQIVLICIIGGIGTIFGPVMGALVLVPLSEALRSNIITQGLVTSGLVREDSPAGQFLKENLAHAHVLIYGILVVVVILFMPDGVLGFLRKMVTGKGGK